MSIDSLYRDHHASVEALARRITRDDSAAEDVASRTFEELPRAMNRYEGESDARSFVLGVCANLARRFRRSDARKQAMLPRLALEPEARPADDPEATAARRELLSHVMRALEELPEEQRNAFLLASVEECTAAEIATASGVPEATVRTRIFHARRKLREALERSARKHRSVIAPAGVVVVVLLLAAAGSAVAAPRAWAAVKQWIGTHLSHVVPWREPASVHPLRHMPGFAPQRLTARSEFGPIAPAVDSWPLAATDAPSASHVGIVRHNSMNPRPHVASVPPETLEPGYLDAHRIHFEEHDYARALVAWDAYLATAPHGRLALEARYNRAIALVRLHRYGDARVALAPFAAGEENGYRREEASRIVAILSTRE